MLVVRYLTYTGLCASSKNNEMGKAVAFRDQGSENLKEPDLFEYYPLIYASVCQVFFSLKTFQHFVYILHLFHVFNTSHPSHP